jgi:hypothetical protein
MTCTPSDAIGEYVILKIGELIYAGGWMPLRHGVFGECPACGFEGEHACKENEDGEIEGQCTDCYARFTVLQVLEEGNASTEDQVRQR